MNVLVACECSQVVTNAFRALGHNAFSCDLKPAPNAEYHLKMSALDALHFKNWDLLIAHPPCTKLSYAGVWNWKKDGEKEKQNEAIEFFMQLYNAEIPHICIENPQGIISSFLPHSQTIHPYYFGDAALKRTNLWLKNLPPLVHSAENTLFETATACPKPAPVYIQKNGKKRHFTDMASNQAARSVFFKGVAEAMATQWSNYLKHP